MSASSLESEEQEPRNERESTLQPGDSRKKLTLAMLAVVFALLLMNQEAWLIELIAKQDQTAGLLWRLGFPLAVLSVAALLPRRARLIAMGIVSFFFTAVTIADAGYFRFFGSIPSLSSVGTAGQLWDVRDSVLQVVVWTDLIPLLYCTIFFVAAYWLSRSSRDESEGVPRAEPWTARLGISISFTRHPYRTISGRNQTTPIIGAN
jgi:phosphoglycerol transferase MdoB-like AlkP superfamily enzyme